MVLGVALALALVADSPDHTAWLQGLKPQGWTLIGETDEAAIFVQANAPPGEYPRIWIRSELQESTGGAFHWYLSSVWLEEVDCKLRRSRTLQRTTYPEQNLSGQSVDSWVDPQPWQYPMPGTLSAAISDRVCREGP